MTVELEQQIAEVYRRLISVHRFGARQASRHGARFVDALADAITCLDHQHLADGVDFDVWRGAQTLAAPDLLAHLEAQEPLLRRFMEERCRVEGWCWNFERVTEGVGWDSPELDRRRSAGEQLGSRPPAGLAELFAWAASRPVTHTHDEGKRSSDGISR